MSYLTFAAPQQVNGARLRDELRSAGLHVSDEFDAIQVDADTVGVKGLAETDRATAAQVIAAHEGLPSAPVPTSDGRLAALEVRAAALETAMNVVPTWAAGLTVEVGQKWQHDGTTYTVVQAHTTLDGWQPPVVPALFTPTG